jgi:polysaccharide pyruvyl transferase WcaK-like protein
MPVLRTSARAVAVVGNYGNRNLGDEATLASLLKGLRLRRNLDILVFSYDPPDTERRHAVRSTPAAPRVKRSAPRPVKWWAALRHLLDTFRRLRGIDLLVFGGGGLLDDSFRGPLHTPLHTATLTVLARLAGAQVAFSSVGAGPIASPISAAFFRFAMRRAARVSFRDEDSQALCRRLRLTNDGSVTTDLVLGLFDRPQGPGSRLDVVINPIAYYDPRYWPVPDEQKYREYVRLLADVAATLVQRGRHVVFVASQLKSDFNVITDIQANMTASGGAGGSWRVAPVEGIDDLFDEISRAEIVIASRFHGVICALAAGRPVLALSSHPKIDHAMQRCDQDEHIVSLRQCDAASIVGAFDHLAANASAAADRIARSLARHATSVQSELDALFGPVVDQHSRPVVSDASSPDNATAPNAMVNARGR